MQPIEKVAILNNRKMNTINIHKCYVSIDKKEYYHQGSVICEKCQTLITNKFILQIDWSRIRDPMTHCFCLHCITKIHSIYEFQERELFSIRRIIPKNARPFIPEPPALSNLSGYNVFQAVYIKSEAQIIDNTKLSGRNNCTFSISSSEKRDRIPINEIQDQIAKQRTNERIRELDSNVYNVNCFFNNISNSFPMIKEEEEKRLLK